MATAELKVVSNATCTFCGCVCDDMELTVEGHTITKAKNACVLGKAWFLNHHIEDRPVATIAGKPATLEEGIEILTGVRPGRRDSNGAFEPDTVFALVDRRLHEMANTLKAFES